MTHINERAYTKNFPETNITVFECEIRFGSFYPILNILFIITSKTSRRLSGLYIIHSSIHSLPTALYNILTHKEYAKFAV